MAVCNTHRCPEDCIVSKWHAAPYAYVGSGFFPFDNFEGARAASVELSSSVADPHPRVQTNASALSAEQRRRHELARKLADDEKTRRVYLQQQASPGKGSPEHKPAGDAKQRLQAAALAEGRDLERLYDTMGWRQGWSGCSVQCGGGWMTRERSIIARDVNRGASCPGAFLAYGGYVDLFYMFLC